MPLRGGCRTVGCVAFKVAPQEGQWAVCSVTAVEQTGQINIDRVFYKDKDKGERVKLTRRAHS